MRNSSTCIHIHYTKILQLQLHTKKLYKLLSVIYLHINPLTIVMRSQYIILPIYYFVLSGLQMCYNIEYNEFASSEFVSNL